MTGGYYVKVDHSTAIRRALLASALGFGGAFYAIGMAFVGAFAFVIVSLLTGGELGMFSESKPGHPVSNLAFIFVAYIGMVTGLYGMLWGVADDKQVALACSAISALIGLLFLWTVTGRGPGPEGFLDAGFVPAVSSWATISGFSSIGLGRAWDWSRPTRAELQTSVTMAALATVLGVVLAAFFYGGSAPIVTVLAWTSLAAYAAYRRTLHLAIFFPSSD